MESFKTPSHLYKAQRRVRHAERDGFHITEIELSPEQFIPWHFHARTQDTFFVLEGRIEVTLREPKETLQFGPGECFTAVAERPHLVTNPGTISCTFLILQGPGDYDYVPLGPNGERKA